MSVSTTLSQNTDREMVIHSPSFGSPTLSRLFSHLLIAISKSSAGSPLAFRPIGPRPSESEKLAHVRPRVRVESEQIRSHHPLHTAVVALQDCNDLPHQPAVTESFIYDEMTHRLPTSAYIHNPLLCCDLPKCATTPISNCPCDS